MWNDVKHCALKFWRGKIYPSFFFFFLSFCFAFLVIFPFISAVFLKMLLKVCWMAFVSQTVSLPPCSSSRAYLHRVPSVQCDFLLPGQQQWKAEASQRHGWWGAPLLLVGAAVLQTGAQSVCVRAWGHAHVSLNCFLWWTCAPGFVLCSCNWK